MNEHTLGIVIAALGAVAVGAVGVLHFLADRAKPRML